MAWGEKMYSEHEQSRFLTSPWLGFRRQVKQLAGDVDGYGIELRTLTIVISQCVGSECLKNLCTIRWHHLFQSLSHLLTIFIFLFQRATRGGRQRSSGTCPAF